MKIKRIRYRVALFLAIFLILISLELFRSEYILETTHYTITINNSNSFETSLRIVQLTDIHDSVFGDDNEKLVGKVKAENPDLIFITGDLVNSHKWKGAGNICKLISNLVEIAPVYISLGNQEMTLIQEKNIEIVDDYEKAGATVLDFSYVDMTIKGNQYRIGGIYGYCRPFAHAIEAHCENESEFLCDFQNTDACKLLLCHLPLCWIDSYSLYDWGVDVVFSGHVHGGQIRMPYLGGLWAPDLGWFPGKLSGIYSTNDTNYEEFRKKLIEYSHYANFG